MTTVTGELEQLGFDEVEPGLVPDTPANRKRVPQLEPVGGWQYERQYDEEGEPTGLIRIFNPTALAARREKPYETYRDLLVDKDDPWSDYVGPDEFPMDAVTPYFIQERLRKWRRAESQGVPAEERKPFPVRCEETRIDGTRCWLWASNPDQLRYCTHHARSAGKDLTRKLIVARSQLMELAPAMVDGLELMANTAESEPVRLKAMTEILDRAGVRAGVEIEISGELEVTDPAKEVRDRLTRMIQRANELERRQAELEAPKDVVEAVVVEDET